MPPKIKITSENLVEAGFAIAKEKGFAGITARNVANYIGCSVAPIYVNFATIDDLAEAVVQRVFQLMETMLKKQEGIDMFQNIGKASIVFAREYPVFLRELALQPNPYMKTYESVEKTILEFMEKDPKMVGWSQEEKKILLLKMQIFQTGLQVMVANGQLPFWLEDNGAERLLMEVGGELQYAQFQKHKD